MAQKTMRLLPFYKRLKFGNVPQRVQTRNFMPLKGLMSDQPLLIPSLLEHAAKWHSDEQIVSRDIDNPSFIHRYCYGEASARAMKLANVLTKVLEIKPGERVATLAFSSHKHFELYYAIPGIGSVCHTVNPRLFPSQINFILSDAADTCVFVDNQLLPVLIEALKEGPLPALRAIVLLGGNGLNEHNEKNSVNNIPLLNYEDLLNNERADFGWRSDLDERSASSMCYTSGTTGLPKGCLFSHRSTLLHTLASCNSDGFGVSHQDSILSVVPMYHVNGWGLPYSAAMVGSKLVFPGANLDGKSIAELLIEEQVTMSAGVPTVWLMLLSHLQEANITSLPDLQRLIIGGSNAPPSLVHTFETDFDVRVRLSWGMTELSPCGVVGSLKKNLLKKPMHETEKVRLKPGRPMYGLDITLKNYEEKEQKTMPFKNNDDDDDDDALLFGRDDETSRVLANQVGSLYVKGPWTISRYWNHEDAAVDDEGWFDTGDMATVDDDSYLAIVDRKKDVIKSGGEWISSIMLEKIAGGHPDVDSSGGPGVAAVAWPHEHWGERPLIIVRVKPNSKLIPSDMIQYLYVECGLPKLHLPDHVILTSEALPLQGTGKVWKMKLREMLNEGHFGEVSSLH